MRKSAETSCSNHQNLHPVEVDGILTWGKPSEALAFMNKRHAVVPIGGKVKILTEPMPDAPRSIRDVFEPLNEFKVRYMNQFIPIKTGSGSRVKVKLKPLGDWWITQARRRAYEGMTFQPGVDTSNFYNTFTGFPIQPVKGDCSLYWNHLLIVVCRGDVKHYEYIRKWMAHAIQRPQEVPGVAIAIVGKQGTGKGTLVEPFGKLFGRHYQSLSKMAELTGKFNGHLRDAILIYANEAIWGGDKSMEGTLKVMITDDEVRVEEKGCDSYSIPNCRRLMITSNESWAAPVGMDDRRFLILEINDKYKENGKYHGAIKDQMENGGLEALMYDLVHEDLNEFDFRTAPFSSYAFDLKLRSCDSVAHWLYNCLYEGSNDSDIGIDNEPDWRTVVLKSSLHISYLEWCKRQKMPHPASLPLFTKELKKYLPWLKETRPVAGVPAEDELNKKRRHRLYVLPKLSECRQQFQKLFKSGPEIWEVLENDLTLEGDAIEDAVRSFTEPLYSSLLQ